MKSEIRSAVLAVVGLGSLATTLTIGVAKAQETGSIGQEVVAPPQWDEGFHMAPMAPMTPVMVQDDGYLYILRGNEVFKLDKSSSSFKVTNTAKLPMPKPMGPPKGEPPVRVLGRPGESTSPKVKK